MPTLASPMSTTTTTTKTSSTGESFYGARTYYSRALAAEDEGKSDAELWSEVKAAAAEYILPPSQPVTHRALVRLAVYAKYGPAVRVAATATTDHGGSSSSDATAPKLRLRGGLRLLSHHEEAQLLAEEQRALVFEAYALGSTRNVNVLARSLVATLPLPGQRPATTTVPPPRAATSAVAPNTSAVAMTDSDFGVLDRGKNALAHDALELSHAELRLVLESARRPVAAAAAGGGGGLPPARRRAAYADAISDALLAEREHRVRELKRSVPERRCLRRGDPDVTRRAAARFYNRTTPKVHDIRNFDNPRDVLCALHRYAFQITDPSRRGGGGGDDGGMAVVNNNVRCLRADFVANPLRDGWDPFCCVRACHAASITTLRR